MFCLLKDEKKNCINHSLKLYLPLNINDFLWNDKMMFTHTETIYILKAAFETRNIRKSTIDQAIVQLDTGLWKKPWSPDGI